VERHSHLHQNHWGMHMLVPPYEIHEVFISHIFTSLFTIPTRRICKTKTHSINSVKTGQRSGVNRKFITPCPIKKNSRFWSARAKFSKLQHWYSTRGPIPTFSCPKNPVTEVLPSRYFWRPNCTSFAITLGTTLGTLMQMWEILVSMISTTYHTTLVFNTR
jgi:hypothetical protein